MLIVKAKDWNVSEMPFSDLAVLRKNRVAARFYLHSCNVRFQILPNLFVFFKCPQPLQSHAHHKSALCLSPTLVFGFFFDLRYFCRCKNTFLSHAFYLCLLIESQVMGWLIIFYYLKIKSHCKSPHLLNLYHTICCTEEH